MMQENTDKEIVDGKQQTLGGVVRSLQVVTGLAIQRTVQCKLQVTGTLLEKTADRKDKLTHPIM
jgi:hypothetical protein